MIAPFPDRCLLVPFWSKNKKIAIPLHTQFNYMKLVFKGVYDITWTCFPDVFIWQNLVSVAYDEACGVYFDSVIVVCLKNDFGFIFYIIFTTGWYVRVSNI